MRAKKVGGGGGPDIAFYILSHQRISERSVPVFLRKPIATFDFHGFGVFEPPAPPPSGSAHVLVLKKKRTKLETCANLHKFCVLYTFCDSTVVPTKSDSDVIFSLQLLSKTLTCTLYLGQREPIDHLCINPILRIELIHK